MKNLCSLQKMNQDSADSQLLQIICDRIQWDKRISLNDIDIVIRNGVTVVSGVVDTSFKKNAALEIISSTEGVWSIEDKIVVPIDYYRSDDELKELVLDQIEELIKIGGEYIEVDVKDGVVTLHGEVYRPRLKAMAVGAVWELSGVRDCRNLIEIGEPPRQAPLHSNNLTEQKEVL
jgi:hyperosmotically inducible protein